MTKLEQAEQELVACKHEWFRTGAFETGESRCILCGKWNFAALQPVKQEPVAWWFQPPNKNVRPMFDTQQHGGKWKPLYEAPVRTKDLTDDEMNNAYTHGYNKVELAIYLKHEAGLRAVIAADREKNK